MNTTHATATPSGEVDNWYRARLKVGMTVWSWGGNSMIVAKVNRKSILATNGIKWSFDEFTPFRTTPENIADLRAWRAEEAAKVTA